MGRVDQDNHSFPGMLILVANIPKGITRGTPIHGIPGIPVDIQSASSIVINHNISGPSTQPLEILIRDLSTVLHEPRPTMSQRMECGMTPGCLGELAVNTTITLPSHSDPFVETTLCEAPLLSMFLQGNQLLAKDQRSMPG